MFLRLGGKKSVRKRDIVGIFDIDDAFTPKDTQAFLRSAQDGGREWTSAGVSATLMILEVKKLVRRLSDGRYEAVS